MFDTGIGVLLDIRRELVGCADEVRPTVRCVRKWWRVVVVVGNIGKVGVADRRAQFARVEYDARFGARVRKDERVAPSECGALSFDVGTATRVLLGSGEQRVPAIAAT